MKGIPAHTADRPTGAQRRRHPVSPKQRLLQQTFALVQIGQLPLNIGQFFCQAVLVHDAPACRSSPPSLPPLG